MKTFELWAEIAECEDGVQIDETENPVFIGEFPTLGEAETAARPHGRRAWLTGTV